MFNSLHQNNVLTLYKTGLKVIRVKYVNRERSVRNSKEGGYLQLQIENGKVIQAKVVHDATGAAKKRIQDKLGC